VLVALSLLALNLSSTVRTEMSIASASGDSEKAYFYARGALEAVIYRIVYPEIDREKQEKLLPYAAGMNHLWMNNQDTYCHVAILDEAGKLDLNYADAPALEKLMKNIGVAPDLSVSLAKTIVDWREPKNSPEARNAGRRKFRFVEELLSVPGMTREILYGDPRRTWNGKTGFGRGMAEFVTVFSGRSQINMNYAEPEVLAALPGLDIDVADSIVQAREKGAIGSISNLSQRITASIPGEALPFLTSSISGSYSLVATAFLKNSKVHRSVKTVIKLDDTLQLKHEKLIWYDEYWPAEQILRWSRLRSVEEVAS
jgi:general secretion pathway protein K